MSRAVIISAVRTPVGRYGGALAVSAAVEPAGVDPAEIDDVVVFSRKEQDAFALESQRRWAAAHEAGRFADELIPVGDVDRDEHPRPDTSAERLAAPEPAFGQRGPSPPETPPGSTTAPPHS